VLLPINTSITTIEPSNFFIVFVFVEQSYHLKRPVLMPGFPEHFGKLPETRLLRPQLFSLLNYYFLL
jgi:hypothetical protein